MACCKCCCENGNPPGECCGPPGNKTCCRGTPENVKFCCNGTACCNQNEHCCNGACQSDPCECAADEDCQPGEICCDTICCPEPTICCGCINGVCIEQTRQAVMSDPPLTPVGNDPFRCDPDTGVDPTNCACTAPGWRLFCRPGEDGFLLPGEVFVGPQCGCGEIPQLKSWTLGKKRTEMTVDDYVFECVPEGEPLQDPTFYPACIDPP